LWHSVLFSVSLLQNIFLFFHYFACRNVLVFAELHIYSENRTCCTFPFCFSGVPQVCMSHNNRRIYSFIMQLLDTRTIFEAILLTEIIDQGVWSRHKALAFCTVCIFLQAFLFPHRVAIFLIWVIPHPSAVSLPQPASHHHHCGGNWSAIRRLLSSWMWHHIVW
jgi:hypothetical protein